jgi:ABC-2 type transport system permease protein
VSGRSGRLVRTLAFYRKDLFEVLRQPRLLLTLVLGPFLILLIIGVGFAPEPPTLRTIVVVPPGSGLESRSEELAEALGSRIVLTEMTDDEAKARQLLSAGTADVLVVVPPNAAEMVRANQQAPIEIYHNQIDPFESSFIEVFADSAVDEINQQILQEVVVAGQGESDDLTESLAAARTAVDAMSAAVERGDEISPNDKIDLDRSLVGLAALAAYRSGILSGVDDVAGSPGGGLESLARAQDASSRLGEPGASPTETGETLATLRTDLDELEGEMTAFGAMDPEVVVSPFVSTIDNVNGIKIDFSHYYVPGVVALLVQHLALTFAALSLVRERTLGSVELFRVSPLTAGEALIGKYLAYLLLGGIVAASLTAGAVAGFGFQIAGPRIWYAAIVFLVLMASLGAGFVISAVARTESEAVQYAMIALLVSIFFSGFFISIDRLIEPVRVISFLLPATYGIAALQEVSFLGQAPDPWLVGGAGLLALILLLSAWALMRKRVVAMTKVPKRRGSRRQVPQVAVDKG